MNYSHWYARRCRRSRENNKKDPRSTIQSTARKKNVFLNQRRAAEISFCSWFGNWICWPRERQNFRGLNRVQKDRTSSFSSSVAEVLLECRKSYEKYNGFYSTEFKNPVPSKELRDLLQFRLQTVAWDFFMFRSKADNLEPNGSQQSWSVSFSAWRKTKKKLIKWWLKVRAAGNFRNVLGTLQPWRDFFHFTSILAPLHFLPFHLLAGPKRINFLSFANFISAGSWSFDILSLFFSLVNLLSRSKF